MSRFGVGFHGYNSEIAIPGNDSFTKVLLHMDGLNGGTSFPDVNAGGVSGRVWTPSGSATTTSSAKKWGSASLLLGTTSSFLSTSSSSDIILGSSDWSFDFQFNKNGFNGTQQIICGLGSSNPVGGPVVFVQFNASNQLVGTVLQSTTGTSSSVTSSAISDPLWHHGEFTKSGGTLYLFVDGVLQGTAGTVTPPASTGGALYIGATSINQTTAMRGLLDEFRLSVGIARHTANFTSPTGPYN